MKRSFTFGYHTHDDVEVLEYLIDGEVIATVEQPLGLASKMLDAAFDAMQQAKREWNQELT